MKKLRITGIEYVKISVDNKTSFDKLNPCSMYWYAYNRKNHLATAFKFL